MTTYVARRLVERQRALAEDPDLLARAPAKEALRYRRQRRWRTFGVLLLGFVLGVVALLAVAVLMATNS